MSKTKNTDIKIKSGLERYFPESPRFDFRKDFETDTLKRLIEGFKRHKMSSFLDITLVSI